MIRALPLLLTCFLALAYLGCAPTETTQSEGDPTTMSDATQTDDDTTTMTDTTAQTIMFEGTFEGPLGLQLWSLRDYAEDDVADVLSRTRAMGFLEVELAGTYGLPPGTFLRMLEEAGLKATSMHAGYDLFRDNLEAVLDEAETLGVTYVGIAWIPHEEGQPFTEAMARETAALFNTWGSAARERGLQFFYHVHGYEFRPGPDGTTPFDILVEETDPEAVQYEMDVFWVTHSGTDPAALLRKYPDRWTLMHVKDMRQGTPTSDYSGRASAEADVPVGTGQVDYQAVLAAAHEIGLARYYIEDESTDPLANIPKSISFLETVTF